jgi:hypothetical protein
MNEQSNRSPFPRLDVLDAILGPVIDQDFIRFVLDRPERAVSLIALGAAICGATRPRQWDDLYNALEQRGRDLIEDYVDAKLNREEIT